MKASILKLLRRIDLHLLLGLALATCTTLLYIGSKSLYTDEAATLSFITSWGHLMQVMSKSEANMWFYYILSYVWLNLGGGVAFLRGLSAIFAISSIVPGYYLLKDSFGLKASRIFLVLLPLNLFFVKNAQYARSYGLLILLTTCSLYFLLKHLSSDKTKYLWIYTILNTLVVYTHLYGILTILAQILYVAIYQKKALTRYCIANISALAATLTIYASPSSSTQSIEWIGKVTLRHFGGLFLILSGDNFTTGAIYFALVLVAIIAVCLGKVYPKHTALLAICVLFPPLAGYIITVLVKPVFVLQYYAASLVPFVALIAVIIGNVRSKHIAIVTVLLVITSSLVRLRSWYQGSTAGNYTVIANNYGDWKPAAKILINRAEKGDGYIVVPTYTSRSLNYYIDQTSREKLTQIRVYPSESGNSVQWNESIGSNSDIVANFDRVWYVYNESQDSDYTRVNSELTSLFENKYSLVEESNLYKVHVKLYEVRDKWE